MDDERFVKLAVTHAVRLGAQYAEARFQHNTSIVVGLRNGIPDPVRRSESKGVGVRILLGGGLAFASTNVLTDDRIRETVELAYKSARAASTRIRKPIALSSEEAVEVTWEAKEKQCLGDLSLEEKDELLADMEDGLSRSRLGVELPARLIHLGEATDLKAFANSEGTMIRSRVPRVSLWFFLTASSEGRMGQRWLHLAEAGGWEALGRWNPINKIVEEAQTLAKMVRLGERAPSGEVDIVLGSEIVGILCHESAGHPQEADRVLGREAAQAGESYLSPGSLGTRIGSDQVTVVDDPTIENSYGFYLYDDEGVKGGRRTLIDHGVISGFLHNRETAHQLGIKSNAGARAVSFNREPIVRMANTYMRPGDYGHDELIEDVRRGVYIKTFMEWNIDDRRFNQRYVGLEANLIENGDVTNPVRNPILEISTPALYGSIDAVGRDVVFEAATCGKGQPAQGAPVWHGGPEVRLRKVRLGGSTA